MPGTLLFNGSVTSEEAHRLIDEAIEDHLASILALKSQRNSFAATSCFPPEILSKIFFLRKNDFKLWLWSILWTQSNSPRKSSCRTGYHLLMSVVIGGTSRSIPQACGSICLLEIFSGWKKCSKDPNTPALQSRPILQNPVI